MKIYFHQELAETFPRFLYRENDGILLFLVGVNINGGYTKVTPLYLLRIWKSIGIIHIEWKLRHLMLMARKPFIYLERHNED